MFMKEVCSCVSGVVDGTDHISIRDIYMPTHGYVART